MKNANHDTFKELYEARHEPENLRPIAEVFWRITLVSALVAVIGVIFFGIWEFSSVMSTMNSATSDSGGQQQAAIDKAQLENALVKFGERKANYELGKNVAPTVADPSK